MRLFASEKIAGLMDKLGFKEGEVLEHNMLSKSVERAQKKVEENNFMIIECAIMPRMGWLWIITAALDLVLLAMCVRHIIRGGRK